MCSIFAPIMDNYQGDLTDIVRASGGAYGSSCSTGPSSSSSDAVASNFSHEWRFSNSDPMNLSCVLEDQQPRGNFGDPFTNMRDPLLHELDIIPSSGSAAAAYYIGTNNSAELISSGVLCAKDAAAAAGFNGSGTASSSLAHKINLGHHEDVMRVKPSNNANIFSNMIQISPNAKLPVSPCDSPVMAASPQGIKPSAMVSGNMINANSSKDCLVDNTGVQISSPRNPGLKRRKSQAKKVVCIPAPAAANSRSSGEVVPSDLWAWRKYGQKPIKGSPYPRGYYRCSSSKGCSARKQVERSRTDPNMLVITYTSEHNHPWPTQRNALAGSTRSQPSRNNSGSKSNISDSSQSQKGTSRAKEEQQESTTESNVAAGNSANSAFVKEEMEGVEKQLQMDDGEFNDGLPYKPSIPECNQSEDFFAELGEIEADPLNLLFTTTQGFNPAANPEQRESKALDPFHLFDWSGDNNNSNTATTFEEPRRGL